jgi:hypothetical protein
VIPVLRVAWYRFRATFRSRWAGLLALVLLIGLLGGVALGAVAGARRTQSSFPAYVAGTNPSDLVVGTAIFNPDIGGKAGYDPVAVAKIARLPHVRQVRTLTGFNPNIVVLRSFHGQPAPVGAQPPRLVASGDGEYSTQDRVVVTQGRLADPRRVGEVVLTAGAAREGGLRVGSRIPLGIFDNAQELLPACCSANGSIAPYRRVTVTVVGIVRFNDTVVQDDVDALGTENVLFTAAFDRAFRQCCSYFSESALQLDHGSRDVAAVERELEHLSPLFNSFNAGTAPSVLQAKAERAIKPQAIALGVFGAIAALATLLIAGQVIGRQLRFGSDDLSVLRALGASPAMTTSDGLVGTLGAVVVGALLATVVAVGVSPLAPIGPVRPVDPSAGIAFDWTVLGIGFGVLVVALSAVALAIAWREAPHRVARRRARTTPRTSRAARAAARSKLPVSATAGIRFALEPGRGRTAVPVRSAMVGAALAVVVVVSALTFGASINTLVSHPALYGWNWHYELLAAYAGDEDLPQQQTADLLDHDPYVAAWTGISFATLSIDGRTVPVLGVSPPAKVGPPLLSGHPFETSDQVVLGATTLAQLHKHVGDTVTVDTGSTAPTRLRIVGTATMPTIGQPGSVHPTMGTGALLSEQLIPASIRNLQNSAVPGPNAVLIRVRDGANPVLAYRSLQKINATLSTGGGVASVQRPAEIVNYRSMGTTPTILGAALAAGAAAALALTLIASVRRRRRDLALLKTLGFTHRQLGAVVAWQSSVAVAIGLVVGIPTGIILGRWLWDLFAHTIHAVPDPIVPIASITVVAVAALVLANVVAALPARQAARAPTALLLRAE